jgi:hypothetical protein
MSKVYLRAVGINKFQWVKNPQLATADANQAMAVTLKKFKRARLEQAPRKSQHVEPGWVITTR